LIELDVILYREIPAATFGKADRSVPFKLRARVIALRRVHQNGKTIGQHVYALAFIPPSHARYVRSAPYRVCEGLCWLTVPHDHDSQVVTDFIASRKLETVLEGA
jgi:hypothetical protein